MKFVSTTSNGHNDEVERLSATGSVELGQWYWVKHDEQRRKGDAIQLINQTGNAWLGCVMVIGSNYVKIRSPNMGSGYQSERIHFDKFFELLTPEPEAERIIQENVAHHKRRISKQLAHVQHITKQLGVGNAPLLGRTPQPQDGASQALTIVSSTKNVDTYKRDLINAQQTLLPKLLKRIKDGNAMLAGWMSAEAMGVEAAMSPMVGLLEDVADRIFNVSLYAGLVETIKQVRTGAPACYQDKLHVMQRMIYMDEECLANYDSGGMEFKDIAAFDSWLARDENLSRILPFSKCLAAFRVRRNEKERRSHDLASTLVNISLAMADKTTYLYCRNGDGLSRLNIDEFEFGAKLFPDVGTYDGSEPLMADMSFSRVNSMITRREYDARVAEQDEQRRLREKWFQDNPIHEWIKTSGIEGEPVDTHKHRHSWANPYDRHDSFRRSDWKPFDKNNVYYDDILSAVKKETLQFNRMALVIQGLFDRTTTFQPHAPIKTWDPESFNALITLVYDGSMVLHHGETPDILAYVAECNAKAGPDSVFYGQRECWGRQEALKENHRNRYKANYNDVDYYEPYGNPGPAVIAKADEWKPRAKKAVFQWRRKSQVEHGKLIEASITVPLDDLFNVSAYKVGDYKRFYADPRTRRDYLEWAPMLLAAEDYHNKNRE